MTTFEHVMLGMNGAIAAGLTRRCGWPVAAVAGLAAAAPDWDGLTLLFSSSAFAAGHRLWGHNVLACVLVGTLIGLIDCRWAVLPRMAYWLGQMLRIEGAASLAQNSRPVDGRRCSLWILVAIIATFSHLLADMLVSGTATLADWEVSLFWPWSRRGWVFPLVPWGDPGMTIVFVVGLFALVRWRPHAQRVSLLTLLTLAAYMLIRGFLC
ncbi:MAG: hypothetical protein GXP27_17745 [Planctomycetes bacterium]|nr:hypothetical protein [Planctomycetota bacterium]